MKKTISVLTLILASIVAIAQCDEVTIQITASDTTYVNLYHAGIFLIPSGEDNICEWEVSSFGGDTIHRDTTSGDFNGQSTSYFNHSIPVTDSMKVSLRITNKTEGITCTMADTLVWQETEVTPGSFIGDWTVMSGNTGMEETLSDSDPLKGADRRVSVSPNPTNRFLKVKTSLPNLTFVIHDVYGRRISDYLQTDEIDLSSFSSGVYFIKVLNEDDQLLNSEKILKVD